MTIIEYKDSEEVWYSAKQTLHLTDLPMPHILNSDHNSEEYVYDLLGP